MKNRVINILSLISEEIGKKLFDCKFILSISGGLDSMSLLNILNDYNLNFITIHFNHKINSQSDKIAEFVKNQIILLTKSKHFTINLQLEYEKNFESCARFKRYFHLENLRRRTEFDFILTAHHLDDQIETLHMKKVQNTHWSNSIGIREAYKNIRRPFLTVYKNDIRNYAIQKKILWIDDITNKNNKHIRNKYRNIDLPKLNKINNKYSLSLLEIRKANKMKFDKIIDIIKKTNFNESLENIGVSINLKTFSRFNNISKKLIIQKYFRDYFNRYDIHKTYKEWQNIFKYLSNNTKRTNVYKIDKVIKLNKIKETCKRRHV